MISGADCGTCIQSEYRTGQLLSGLDILLLYRDLHLLAVSCDFCRLLDDRCLLIRISKRYRLRLFVQDKSDRAFVSSIL